MTRKTADARTATTLTAPDRSARIRVLVADAQCLFAEALGAGLRQYPDIEVVARYPTTGADAVEAVTRSGPQVALIDYWIPGMKGTVVAKAVREWAEQSGSGAKVLLLSWLHGRQHVQEALHAGAIGFLPKSLHLDQVADAVRQAHAGHPLVHGEELARLVDETERRADKDEKLTDLLKTLSPREVQTLQALGTARPRDQVAKDLGIAVGTLANHIHKILAKTGARDVMEVVTIARRKGIIGDIGFVEE